MAQFDLAQERRVHLRIRRGLPHRHALADAQVPQHRSQSTRGQGLSSRVMSRQIPLSNPAGKGYFSATGAWARRIDDARDMYPENQGEKKFNAETQGRKEKNEGTRGFFPA